MTLRKVTLHGALGEKYGGPYRLDVSSAAEAVYALAMQMPHSFLHEFGHGSYFLDINNRPVEQLEEIGISGRGDIDVYPAILASKAGGGRGKSIGMIIAGTVLLGAAVVLSGGTAGGLAAAMAAGGAGGLALSAAASIGASLILTGVTGLLSPVPKMQDIQSPRNQGKTQSFLYHGPVNRDAEGGPVPLVYGPCIVGSVRIGGGTVVTSSISEGRMYVVLDAVAIGGFAFNHVLPDDAIISDGGAVEMFRWERKDQSAADTEWDWEMRVSWDGGDGSSLPNETYLKVSSELLLSDGSAYYGGYHNDAFHDYNGPIVRSQRIEIPAKELVIEHRIIFKMEGEHENTNDIQLNSFYSRLRRVA